MWIEIEWGTDLSSFLLQTQLLIQKYSVLFWKLLIVIKNSGYFLKFVKSLHIDPFI